MRRKGLTAQRSSERSLDPRRGRSARPPPSAIASGDNNSQARPALSATSNGCDGMLDPLCCASGVS